MSSIIAWFFLLLFSFFVYVRIFNLKDITLRKVIYAVLFTVVLTIVTYLLLPYIPLLRFIMMISLGGAFTGRITSKRLDLAITGFAMAVGISYGFFLLSTIPVHSIIRWLPIAQSDIIIALLTPLPQFALIYLLFSIRRMKKGMLFLKDRGAGIVGLVISSIILAAIVVVPLQTISHEVRLIFIVSAVISVAGIIVWWRKELARMYRKNIQQRAIQGLEEEHAKLRESNQLMEELIHRDNKLLAALYAAVEHTGQAPLRTEIEALMQDRMAAIGKAQRAYKALPKTNDAMLDGVMQSMLAQASERDIQFDLALFDDIARLLETVAPVKLCALLSDLLENAMIAVTCSEYRRVFASFGYRDGCYELSVQDSGIPFEKATLEKLGRERASTHLGQGGSGIGYMAIFGILREYGASLIITQNAPKAFRFAKTVTVRFDGKGEYIVNHKDESRP